MSTFSERWRVGAWLAACGVAALLAGCDSNNLDNHIAACDDYCAVAGECDDAGGRECTATCEDMIRVGWEYSRECGNGWESWFGCMGSLTCAEWAAASDEECADGLDPSCHCGDLMLEHRTACN